MTYEVDSSAGGFVSPQTLIEAAERPAVPDPSARSALRPFWVLYDWNGEFGPSIYRVHGMCGLVLAHSLQEARDIAQAHHRRIIRVSADRADVGRREIADIAWGVGIRDHARALAEGGGE